MSPRKPKYTELTEQVADLKRENARLVGLLHEVGLSEVPLTWADLNPVAPEEIKRRDDPGFDDGPTAA
jgi:hypothetical protein